jgi:two-component system cell cycle sensor histidine kinase/response regulator CckA
VAQIPSARRADAAPGSYVSVSIADTGSGIPPEILPRIFEPFFTTKPAGRGTGLGLATVFGIAQQHKGWIDVDTRVGGGTTMHVWLPESRSAPGARPASTPTARLAGKGEAVLVVEDDAAVRALMWAVLSRNGYNVFVARDSVDALGVWQANADTIQLLLTDIVLSSGMNGRELASRLQAERQELRVLLTTGYTADLAGTRIDANELPGFLRKPFTPDQLLAAVRGALDNPPAKS